MKPAGQCWQVAAVFAPTSVEYFPLAHPAHLAVEIADLTGQVLVLTVVLRSRDLSLGI